MRGASEEMHACAAVSCEGLNTPLGCVQEQAGRPDHSEYGSATYARSVPRRGRIQLVAAGVSVVCCVVAIGLWSSRSHKATVPSTKRLNFWPQQLEQDEDEDGDPVPGQKHGPKHAGDGAKVSNPFEVAYTHPPQNAKQSADLIVKKWKKRMAAMFSGARNLGELGDETGYNDMDKLPKEGIVQGANLPQHAFLRLRKQEELPDQSKMFGPKDKMVPAAEYIDSPHNEGWDAQTYGEAQNYLAHLHGDLDYKSFWDTADIINAALRDQVVKQDVFEKEDGEGNQGRQWGGVVVDWRTLYHQVKQEPGSNLKDMAPHFAHLSDGSVHLDMPKGGTLPFRASVPITIFRPCHEHPFKGCVFEPPMHVPSGAPKALPPRDVQDVDDVDKLIGGDVQPEPKEFVDQEDERFNKPLFGLASVFESDTDAPISLEDVQKLVQKAVETAGSDWAQDKINTNVFKYVLENYEVDPDAKEEIQKILAGKGLAAKGKGASSAETEAADDAKTASSDKAAESDINIESAIQPIAKALGMGDQDAGMEDQDAGMGDQDSGVGDQGSAAADAAPTDDAIPEAEAEARSIPVAQAEPQENGEGGDAEGVVTASVVPDSAESADSAQAARSESENAGAGDTNIESAIQPLAKALGIVPRSAQAA